MKQAVVLIHGIGEQVPMETLRGFVRAVWSEDREIVGGDGTRQVWSKPDEISEDFELRRITTADARNGKRTDFFEFYWADLMEDTTLQHVVSWVGFLLFRWPWRVPRQVRPIWWFMVLLALAIAVAWGHRVWEEATEPKCACCEGDCVREEQPARAGWRDPWAWVRFGGPVLWLFASRILVRYVGDAARYLRAKPENIACRRAVRAAGIRLLERLHEKRKYDRVIVVGHSLGSVIGYDMLSHYWPKVHREGKGGAGKARDELMRLIEHQDYQPERFQAAQQAYLRELREGGSPWLVTDFVTLGSPLTHAEMLLAHDRDELRLRQAERELPTCPPELEAWDGGRRVRPGFTYRNAGVEVPHHAAVFAPVRWTNLFFPCRATLWGDFVGGPVRGQFGRGVNDVEVHTKLRGGFFTHTCYWTVPTGQPDSGHLIALRRALRLAE